MAAYLVGEEASDLCLHLCLCWDIIVNLKGVNVGGQRSARGVRVLLLVEGGVILGDLIDVVPGRVGRPGGRVAVQSF